MSETKLVSIESQTEQSLLSGKSETRIFVKMYVDAVRTGLIADMGAKNWTTLCVIASYMNKKGECYPTQSQIAKGLGVSRQTANKYINDLLAYRRQEQELIVAEQPRNNGQFSALKYSLKLRIIEPPVSNIYAIESFNLPHGESKMSPKERVLLRAISGYRRWVFDVKANADFTCEVCGSTSDLVAHHLNNYHDFPEQRTDILNGICLCSNCHSDFHSKYGMKRTTALDFDNYLSEVKYGCK